MATNRWQLGVMYWGGKVNGQPFFTQPGGPGTEVFPTQVKGQQWIDWPVAGMVINEWMPWVTPGCQHSVSWFSIVHEFDYDTNQSAALLLCPICGYCQRAVEPYEEILNPIQYPVIVA